MRRIKLLIRESGPPVILFVVADLTLTLVFFGISSPATHIGTLRPVSAIPLKVLALAGAGLVVGLVTCLAAKRFDLGLVTMAVVFTAFLDMDHLPSMFGVAQPIRPAHSLMFLAVMLVGLGLVARRRYDIQSLFAASFFAHMASDTGIFAFFAPFSFAYESMNEYRIPLAFLSLLFALLAGYLNRRERSPTPRNVTVDSVMSQT